jgi:hypothetical protein
MKEQWRPFADCDFCGCTAEVLTRSGEDEVASDDDLARCTDCGAVGVVNVDDGGDPPCAFIEWADEWFDELEEE